MLNQEKGLKSVERNERIPIRKLAYCARVVKTGLQVLELGLLGLLRDL